MSGCFFLKHGVPLASRREIAKRHKNQIEIRSKILLGLIHQTVHTSTEHGNTPEAQQLSMYGTLIIADQRTHAPH